MQYPKIETVFTRGEDFKVQPHELRLPEFDLIDQWLVTEKIDGTNIRVRFQSEAEDDWAILFYGRTDKAQIPPFLLSHLKETFTYEKLSEAFTEPVSVTLFGEGYGPKIQKGGGNYRHDVSFRLFDVVIHGEGRDWWLVWEDVVAAADRLGIKTVPHLPAITSITEAVKAVADGQYSIVADEEKQGQTVLAEGVVARTDPPLFTRRGQPLMWKLKAKDF